MPVSMLSQDILDAWQFDALGIPWLPLLVKQWCGKVGYMGRGGFHLLLHRMTDLSRPCRFGFEHRPGLVPMPPDSLGLSGLCPK